MPGTLYSLHTTLSAPKKNSFYYYITIFSFFRFLSLSRPLCVSLSLGLTFKFDVQQTHQFNICIQICNIHFLYIPPISTLSRLLDSNFYSSMTSLTWLRLSSVDIRHVFDALFNILFPSFLP